MEDPLSFSTGRICSILRYDNFSDDDEFKTKLIINNNIKDIRKNKLDEEGLLGLIKFEFSKGAKEILILQPEDFKRT